MGKSIRVKRKTKTKSKKSSRSKSKTSKMNKANTGAPEIRNDDDIINQEMQDESTEIKVMRKAMKIQHEQIHAKTIRKTEKLFNKLSKTGNENDILVAQKLLDEAVQERDEAMEWLHPEATIKELNSILQRQIEMDVNIDNVEETRNYITDAEEALQLIQEEGNEETMFFKILHVNPAVHKNGKSNEEEMDIQNEDIINLPNISPQMEMNKNDNSKITKEGEKVNEDDCNINFITPSKAQTKISDFVQNSNKGDETPKTKTTETPINVMQEQLQNALKVFSPQEKIKKIRQQAKANAAEAKRKIQEVQMKEKNRKLQNNSSSNRKGKVTSESEKPNPRKVSERNKSSKNKNQTPTDINRMETDSDDQTNEEEEESSQSENDESMDEDSEEEFTPKKSKQSKISIHRNYNTYFSVKLKIEKGGIATKQLLKSLKTFYAQLYLIDPDIAIYDYESAKPTQAILSSKNIPHDFSIMKTYFNNINVKPNGGHTWFQVWIGHTEPIENITVNMKHWSSENDSFLYKKRLQEKFTAKDYWLLWSTERMDHEILKDEIDELTMKIVKKKFQLSFNFGMVRKDTKFSNNSTPSKWNKAMIIEVKREEKTEAYSILGRIFSTSNNIKVLGTEMRMIPVLNSDLPSHTKRKVARMTHKQEQFLSTLMTKPCVYLSDIDYYNSTLNTTLRDIIMDLETLKTFDAEGNPMKVFINVDYSDWHSAYVLTFPKHLEKEADDFITQLPAYLNYVYGEEVLFMLTAEGAVKANESKWDEENLCATSNLDLELDAIELESSSKAWLPELQDDIIAFDTAQIEMQGKLHIRSTDADSVSTFASKKKRNTIILEPEHSSTPNDNDQEDKNQNSNISVNTSDSEQSQTPGNEPKSYQSSIIEEEYSESSSVTSKERDQKARKPSSQDTMNTSKSAVSNLEGDL